MRPKGSCARSVVHALSEGPKTPEQLMTITGLPRSTLHSVLRRLGKKHCLRREPNLMDMRYRVYTLVGKPRAVLRALVTGMLVLLISGLLIVPVTADKIEDIQVDAAHFSLLRPHPNGTVYDRFELVPYEEDYLQDPRWYLQTAVLTQVLLCADQWFENYTLSNGSFALRLRFCEYDVSFETENDTSLATSVDAYKDERGHLYGHEALLSVRSTGNLTSPVFVEVAVYQTWNLTYTVHEQPGDYIHIREPSAVEILLDALTLIPLTIFAVWRNRRMRRNRVGKQEAPT